MRLLAFSDSHLGLMAYGISERLKDMAAILDEVAQLAIDRRVDLVINGGDTFDSGKPDPYSVRKYREFVDKLENVGIPYLEVVGNHNRSQIMDKLGEGVWPTALHTWPICADREGWIRQVIGFHSVVAANWMPREQLLPFLALMRESPPEILVLHQSCAGFLPRIAHAEVSFEELAGCARYVAIGDTHVWGVHVIGDTTIVSTGPTEMVKIDEEPVTSVALVTIENDVEVERIRLHPRRQLILEVRSELELIAARAAILHDVDHGIIPMVSIVYASVMERGVEALREEMKGRVLWRSVPDGEVDASASFQAAKASANTEMPAILDEMINDDPQVLAASKSLWDSPDHHQVILEALLTSIRERLAPTSTYSP